jgi:hypothetical protein
MGKKKKKLPEFQFTCGHCGKDVPWIMFEGKPRPRNHCPYCLWSKHVSIGADFGYPPCGAMMRGVSVGESEVVLRCLGCEWETRQPTDDYLYRALAARSLIKGIGKTEYRQREEDWRKFR